MFRFQSTPSARRATGVLSAVPYISGYFNPRPPRGGRPGLPRRHGRHPEISIHALREEGDPGCVHFAAAGRDFNPRPPRGGRHIAPIGYAQTPRISIHALREEGDRSGLFSSRSPYHFNPRPPRGGRPGKAHWCRQKRRISIHALREEGDGRPVCALFGALVISIHALREEGDNENPERLWAIKRFQSTPSARRATAAARRACAAVCISIHALREEGDKGPDRRHTESVTDFNPRPPRGGRPTTSWTKASSL